MIVKVNQINNCNDHLPFSSTISRAECQVHVKLLGYQQLRNQRSFVPGFADCN